MGAHVVPPDTNADDYVALVQGEMLDACKGYAKWIDVFCDRGAFDVDQARTILTAGMARGLEPRVHANQLQHGGGVLSSGGGAGRPISRGQVLFVPAGTPLTVTADADTVVWIAAPNGMGF